MCKQDRKYIEWKLKIVEKEIGYWEKQLISAKVILRRYKQKQWDLIEQLEALEGKK